MYFMDKYFLTLEKEVLREMTASIKASITHYLIKNEIAIDDVKERMRILLNKVNKMSNSLIEKDYTMEELEQIKIKLQFIKEFTDEVEENDA